MIYYVFALNGRAARAARPLLFLAAGLNPMSMTTLAEATSTRVADRAAEAVEIEVILNAAAGTEDKEAARARLLEVFAAAGITTRVMLAHSGAEIEEFARRAAAGAAKTVVAGGGDGTLSTVAAQLVDTDKIFGVLPLGTLNHFAKDLHIPLDVEAAAQTIIAGHVARVDVGEVNGRVFINNSSLGLYPRIVRQRELQERHGHSRWLAFLWALVVVFKRFPFLHVRLSADGRELDRRTPFVFIGNNEYEMDSFNVGARTCLNRGLLSLHVTHKAGRGRLIALALRALFGRLRAAKDFDSLCAREVWVETQRTRLSVATDGEITVMHTPLHYRVRPGALRVIVPRNNEA